MGSGISMDEVNGRPGYHTPRLRVKEYVASSWHCTPPCARVNRGRFGESKPQLACAEPVRSRPARARGFPASSGNGNEQLGAATRTR